MAAAPLFDREGTYGRLARAVVLDGLPGGPIPLARGDSGRAALRPGQAPSARGALWQPLAAPAPSVPGRERDGPASLEAITDYHVARTIVWARGNLSVAARQLGISRATLYARFRRWIRVRTRLGLTLEA